MAAAPNIDIDSVVASADVDVYQLAALERVAPTVAHWSPALAASRAKTGLGVTATPSGPVTA